LDTGYLSRRLTLASFVQILDADVRLHAHNSFLVILNTRAAAKTVYQQLKQHHQKRLVFLSSDLTPKDRLARIAALQQAGNRIVISTQLVEAGVDIDMDRVYRDMAPLDAVFQSAGRCNRNNKGQPGPVFLVSLVDDRGNRFANMIYDEFNLAKTQKLLEADGLIQESHFFTLAQAYYQAMRDLSDFTDSEDILAHMQALNYDQAFNYPKHKHAFHLIEERNVQSALVLQDRVARNLYAAWQLLRQDGVTGFERKHQMKKVLRQLAPYMVNVKRDRHEKPQELLVIDERGDWAYDPETGVYQPHNIHF